jgi:hypothetical protein
MSDLADLIGAPVPDGVGALSAADQARLGRMIAGAREKQAADLEAAFAATLKHVPFPVRGLAKRMLLG